MISVRPKRRLGTCVPAGGVSEARNSTPSGRAGVDIWLGLPPALARRARAGSSSWSADAAPVWRSLALLHLPLAQGAM